MKKYTINGESVEGLNEAHALSRKLKGNTQVVSSLSEPTGHFVRSPLKEHVGSYDVESSDGKTGKVNVRQGITY